ncbi:MAG: phosphatase PAP2 family protein [Elusimicrobia bacterium]|nr:phosphatase PAP2 family protein [Elusimicrobiota bacterium]
MRRRLLALAALVLLAPAAARADCAHLIDCRVRKGTSGVWALAPSPAFPAAVIGLAAVGAVYDGGETRLGKTLWQSLDSAALSGAATFGLKESFQRARPTQSQSPDDWFSGRTHQSFPSGDVSAVTSVTFPLIAEYRSDHPSVWALALLPLFDMAARVKYNAHWPTDVLAGAAVGAAAGWAARRPSSPVILGLLPHGFAVGLRARF